MQLAAPAVRPDDAIRPAPGRSRGADGSGGASLRDRGAGRAIAVPRDRGYAIPPFPIVLPASWTGPYDPRVAVCTRPYSRRTGAT